MLLNNAGILTVLFVLWWRRSWCLHHFLFGKTCFIFKKNVFVVCFYFKQPDFLKHFIFKETV